jgi:hypothetical protein
MIKINVFNQADFDAQVVKRAVDAYFAEREVKSFSERHPELGKMVNCPVCLERHRSARVCVPTYAVVPDETDEQGQPVFYLASQYTRKGVYGAKNFKGRILKHRNAWGLQVLERATILFRQDIASFPSLTTESIYLTKEQKAERDKELERFGRVALSRSLNEFRKKRADRRRKFQKITKASRKANRA